MRGPPWKLGLAVLLGVILGVMATQAKSPVIIFRVSASESDVLIQPMYPAHFEVVRDSDGHKPDVKRGQALRCKPEEKETKAADWLVRETLLRCEGLDSPLRVYGVRFEQ